MSRAENLGLSQPNVGNRGRNRGRVRTAFLAAFAIVCGTALGTTFARTIRGLSPPSGGVLDVELVPSALDLGKVQRGTVAMATVKLVNHGMRPLVLAHIGTNCGCTVAERPVDPIGPGEAADITVRMSASDTVGRFTEKTLTFNFEGTGDRVTLPVSCTSAEFVRLSSHVLDPKAQETQYLTIESNDDRSFRIGAIEPDVLDGRSSHALTRHELRLSREKWFALGEPRTVTLRLEHPKVEELLVKIGTPTARGSKATQPATTAQAGPDTLQVAPQRISFGELRTGEAGGTAEVLLRGIEVAEPGDLDIAVDGHGLACHVLGVRPTDGGTLASIQLIADATAGHESTGAMEFLLIFEHGGRRGSATAYATIGLEPAGGP